jgi:hypothetical protein
MPVIGLICCQVLEMEFAHVLANDTDVGPVIVLKTDFSDGFSKTFERLRGKPPIEILSLDHNVPVSESITVLVNVLQVGLHTVIKDLQTGIFQAASAMAPHVDLFLLGYGLCGNALANPVELLASVNTPVMIPTDEDHAVDDCIGLLIGGREQYYSEQCKCAGTMFMTSGWANHWKDIMLKQNRGSFGCDISKRLMANYERVLVLSTSVMSSEEMTQQVREFGELYQLRTEVRDGTLSILEQTWQNAKEKVNWLAQTYT